MAMCACAMTSCACVLLLLAQYTKQMKRARVKGIVDFAKYIIKMLFFDFIQLIGNKDHLLEFLIQHGVIPSTINCEKCDEILFLDKETLLFRCRKKFLEKRNKKKSIARQCDFKKSCKVGTWFGRSNLDLATICKIVASFLMLRPPRQEDLEEELGLSPNTVVDWFSFCREVNIYINIKF